VDVARRVGDRLPILDTARGGFEFREAAVAINLAGRPRGVIAWDIALGWVLLLDPTPDGSR
jgi:hypothetical protein